jgi:hypothetical protein
MITENLFQSDKHLDALLGDIRRAVKNHKYEFTDDGLMLIGAHTGIQIGGVFDVEIKKHSLVLEAIDKKDSDFEKWAREFVAACGDNVTKANYESVDYEQAPNLIPMAGRTFNLSLLFGDAVKITPWYLALFVSNSTPLSTWESNWAGASSGPVATELPDASYDEDERQAAVFPAAATSGAIATSTPTSYTIAAGVTGVSLYGSVLTDVATPAYNATDKVLMAATRFASTKAGLDATDAASTNYSIACTST